MSQKYTRSIKYCILALVVIILAFFIQNRFVEIGNSTYGMATWIIAIGIIVLLAAMYFKDIFTPRTAAIIIMAFSVIISLFTIRGNIDKHFMLWSWSEAFSTSIKPGVLSSMCGICFIFSIIVRNNPKKFLNSVADYIILIEDILFLASFLNVLCSKDPLPIPGVTISCQTFLFFAIAFSWLGMRQIAGFVWLAVIVLGALRLNALEVAWGFTGAIYIIAAFVSFIIQCWKIYNFGSLSDFRSEFLGPVSQQIAGDINASTRLSNNSSSHSGTNINKTIDSSEQQITVEDYKKHLSD